MLGLLPKTLNIGGIDRAIRSDFRVALNVMQAFNDAELTLEEKFVVMLSCLYVDPPNESVDEAVKKAVWFLDGVLDGEVQTTSKPYEAAKRTMDWEQDEQLIFSAINHVAGTEVRAVPYLHWWTFLGYFNEIGEGLFSTVINIRQKRNSGKKLEKHEQEFYRKHKDMIDLKSVYTAQEQAEMDELNKMLG